MCGTLLSCAMALPAVASIAVRAQHAIRVLMVRSFVAAAVGSSTRSVFIVVVMVVVALLSPLVAVAGAEVHRDEDAPRNVAIAHHAIGSAEMRAAIPPAVAGHVVLAVPAVHLVVSGAVG